MGALVSIRKESAADWQAGVVRRVKRFEGNRIELWEPPAGNSKA